MISFHKQTIRVISVYAASILVRRVARPELLEGRDAPIKDAAA